ncbi:HAL9 [Candida metapsilosis]|uniref:HAL9 n=1 Tax=Candida metapsilosis TaxID=273372 RepID=A0A8H8D9V4_9ASCO|nr:HAL9 [Candida metapsilosis]
MTESNTTPTAATYNNASENNPHVSMSGNHSPATDTESKDGFKKRIKIACDICRRKKIKCDGSYPCENCRQSKKPKVCSYTERSGKRQPRIQKPNSHKSNHEKSNTKPKTVLLNQTNGSNIPNSLDSRMSKLENVLERLTSTVELLADRVVVTKTSNSDSERTFAVDSDSREATSRISEHGQDGHGRLYGESREGGTEFNANHGLDLPKMSSYASYIGTQSIFSIFSKESLDWMQQKLGPRGSECITPLKNTLLVCHNKLNMFLNKWIDPPLIDAQTKEKLMKRPFPSDSKFVMELVEGYGSIPMISFLVEVDTVRKLFESYYEGVNDASKRKNFTASELLIMTSALMIGLDVMMDKTKHRKDSKLHRLQDKLLENAIYYYHRICLVSEGLETIEGILLLISYCESNWITNHINYIPKAVAVRYAQEIGLHRIEYSHKLSHKEQDRRRIIWWFCYYYDTDLCFRYGKPPSINIDDVTTCTEADVMTACLQGSTCYMDPDFDGNEMDRQMSIAVADEALLGDPTQPLSLRLLQKLKSFHDRSFYYHFYGMLLAKIKSESYNLLFSASARLRDFDSLSNALEHLNREMSELASYVSEEDKPRFFNDPLFHFIDADVSISERGVMLGGQLAFFAHLMVINRFPFVVQTDKIDAGSQILKFRNTSLDAARTILVLMKQVDKNTVEATFMNWVTYYPIIAFLTLGGSVLNHPNSPDVPSDIKLLTETSMGFFDFVGDFSRPDKHLHTRGGISIELIIRLMLKVVITAYENETGVRVLQNDEALRAHLNNVEVKFPELYQETTEFSNNFPTFFGQSFFETGEDWSSEASSSVSMANTVSPYASSPRYNPAVSNIMHPDQGSNNTNYSSGNQYPTHHHQHAYHSPQTRQHQQLPGISPSPLNPIPSFVHPVGQAHHSPNRPNLRPAPAPMMNVQGNSTPVTSGSYMDNGYDGSNQSIIDGAPNMFLNQMNSMPNFFFDNNLGI